MYQVILYRAGEVIKRSKPMSEYPSDTFLFNSKDLYRADRHEIIEGDNENE